MRILILAVAVLAMFSAPALAAHPQPTLCMPHVVFIERLKNEYSERVIFKGIADNGVLEVLVNPLTETWTILATWPDLGTCMWASGTGIEIIDPGAPSVGSDT